MQIKKRLTSGKYVDLANFGYDDISLDDIEQSLNSLERFGGHWKDKRPLTVAQHTLLCSWLANGIYEGDKDIYKATVIHDFAEAYYGDFHPGLKKLAMESPAFAKVYNHIDKIVHNVFYHETELPFEIKDAVEVCDYLSLDIERRCMWNDQRGKDMWPPVKGFGLTLETKRWLFDEAQGIEWVDLRSLLDGNIQLSFEFS